MPSGVAHVSASRSPLTSFAASVSQSDRVGRSRSPMRERVRPTVEMGEVGRPSAGLREVLGADRVLERSAGARDAGPADGAGAGVEVPVAPVDGAAPTPARRGHSTGPLLRRGAGRGGGAAGRLRVRCGGGVDEAPLRAHTRRITGGYDSYSDVPDRARCSCRSVTLAAIRDPRIAVARCSVDFGAW